MPAALELDASSPVAIVRLTGDGDAENLAREIDAVCGQLNDRDDIRAVTLTAADGALSHLPDFTDVPRAAPFRSLELLPQPVITCIEDGASGTGFDLALACDVRICSERATFSMPQVARGDLPSPGAINRLLRLAGRTTTAAVLLLGETLDARAALACGLVNRVVAPGQAVAEGARLAGRIAERGPLAVRYAKEAIARGLDMPLEQALRYETDLTIILQTTADRAEGVRAFLEKRPPRFDGT